MILSEYIVRGCTDPVDTKSTRNYVDLRSSNPKEFWSLLCTNDRKDKANNIKLDDLSEYFCKLNQYTNNYVEMDFQNAEDKQ